MFMRPSPVLDTRVVYCGDCLEQLKKLPDRSIDLVYIDPPFNSNRRYEAFWGEEREERAFEDRHASTQAYIDYMRPRCEQLARVLKKDGSFFYHCDWHASHYVKVMLDQILGEGNFRNEIIWQRTTGRKSERQFPRIHDSIYFYTGGGNNWTWHPPKNVQTADTVKGHDLLKKEGSIFRLSDFSGGGSGPARKFGERGEIEPPKGRHWMFDQAGVDSLLREGRIYFSRGGMPRLMTKLEDLPGIDIGDVWTDIQPLNSSAAERVGYPTQKPMSLLERIISASSNKGDVVLDAFCGCGTAVTAAEKLGRQWIGIDVSPTACRVMAKRLRYECNLPMNEKRWKKGQGFIIEDLPKSEELLRDMPPFEFESWAVLALSGTPNVSKVRDMGIDGKIYPKRSAKDSVTQTQLDFMDIWYPVQVKQQDRVGRPEIDKLEAAMERTRREKGVFVAFSFSHDAKEEAHRYFTRTGKVISLITVRDILDGHLHEKLA
jgi:DNA modification methylase